MSLKKLQRARWPLDDCPFLHEVEHHAVKPHEACLCLSCTETETLTSNLLSGETLGDADVGDA